MKISTILIYATLLLYANGSFTHERNDLKDLKRHLQGSLKNIILKSNPIKINEAKLTSIEKITETISFQDGQVTLINFWATWCVPCREEMPSLNNLVESIASDNFSVIVIAAGRNSNETIKDFFLKYELTNLKSFKDTKGNFASKMNVLGLPTTLIVDQHSNVIARLVGGADWNSPDAINFINAILKHPN